MPHHTELIATMSVALALAFVAGFVATRLHLPAIVGYLLAGVAVGPFTPGSVADTELAPQLAEIGVILLMFGVGIHFSLRDLLAVRAVALGIAYGSAVLFGVSFALGAFLAGLVVGESDFSHQAAGAVPASAGAGPLETARRTEG